MARTVKWQLNLPTFMISCWTTNLFAFFDRHKKTSFVKVLWELHWHLMVLDIQLLLSVTTYLTIFVML